VNDTSPDAASESLEEWPTISLLPLEQVRDFFVRFGRAFKGFQLYEPNNPVYQRFLDELREAFAELWKELARLRVAVEEDRFTVEGEVVLQAQERADSIPFLFYKDGIREMTFLEGFEEEELERFLEVMRQARQEEVDGDDLLTLLWNAELDRFQYQYIDVFALESLDLPEAGPGATPELLESILQDVHEEEAGASEPEVGQAALGPEDLNPTLYSLDPRELEQLNQEIDKEMSRELQAEVLASLFDRLEEPDWPERQSRILEILRDLFPSFLGRGAFEDAARVLEELHTLESTPGVFDPKRREELHELVAELSSADTIGELVRTLEDGSVDASARHLSEYMGQLSSRALAPLLEASEGASSKLQPFLRRAVTGIAQRHQGALVKLLRSDNPVVAAGAARLVGVLQVVQAAAALPELLARDDPRVRLAAVEAASGIKASLAAKALQDALDDPDAKVRVAAARALGKLRYRPSAPRFRELITSGSFHHAELSERIIFFESYADLGDPETLAFLDKILNGKGLLGRRESPEQRACAALALGRVGSREALDMLARSAADDNQVVKSAVSRALREEIRRKDRRV
jgi:hypothetical protein